MLSKFLIALGVLLALAVAAVLIGPSFVDWNSYRQQIAAKVEQATGRDLEIAGDISVSVLPTPTLSAAGVRFANVEGGSAPDMATLDALEVRIAPWPLLRGDIRVERVALVNPTILLETTADGRSNWEFGGDAAEPPPEAGAPGATPASDLDVSLDDVRIENGTVIYRDAGAGIERVVTDLGAEITAETLRGPFRAAGSAVVGDDPITFDVNTGRLVEGQSATLGIRLGLTEADAALRFAGSLALRGAESRARGKLEGTASSLARLIAALSATGAAGDDLPFAADENLTLTGNLDATAATVALTDLSFRIGGSTGSGAIEFVPGAPGAAEVELAFNQLDLDSLLAARADDDRPATDPDIQEGGPADGGDAAPAFALPSGIDADIEVTVAALIYRKGLVNNLRLDAALADGRLEIERLSALLPGGSDIALAGTLLASEGVPRLTGSLEANATNFRGLLEWLDLGVAGVPSERLRNMSLVSGLTATPSLVEITDIDLRLDTSRVRGGVVIALPTGPQQGKPGFGIGLAVDQVNLDAYLPDAAAERQTTEGRTSGEQTTEAAETVGLASLADLAANLDLRFGTLVYNGQTLEGVRLDGTVQNGVLTLRELSVAQFAGGQGMLSGTITDLAGTPRFDTTFDLTTRDADRALALAGLAAPARRELGPKLGALTLGGTLSGGADAVTYDATFSAAGVEAEGRAEGTVSGFAAANPSLDTTFEVAARNPAPLLDLAGLPTEPAGRLGAVSVTGSVATGDDGRLTYDLSAGVAGIDGEGRLAGTLSDLGTLAPTVAAELEVSVARPAPVLELAGLRAPTNESEDAASSGDALGPVSLAATAEGTTEALRLSDLVVQAGPSRVTGTVDFDGSGPRPRLVADLRGGEVALGWLAALGGGQAPAASGAEAGSGAESTAESTEAGQRWPDAPLDLSALQALDAEIGLVADALRLGDTRFDEAQLALTLEQGELVLERFTGDAYGGAVELTGRLASRSVPSATAELTATEVDLDRLIGGGVAERVRGPVSIRADLRTSGLSVADMIGALDGAGELEGTVTVLSPAEQQVGAALLGILGAEVEAVRGVTDRINALYSGFTGEPNALSGSFRIENGVLRTEDTTLAGTDARATASGTADLEAWVLDMVAQVYRSEEDAEEPFLTIDLEGPIDAPNMDFGGAALSSGGSPLGGVLQEILPEQPEEEAPAEPSDAGAPTQTDESPAAEPEEPARSFEALIPGLIEKLRRQQE